MYLYVPTVIYIVDDMMVMCCVFLQGGENGIHLAARGGHLDIMNNLLKVDENLIQQTNNVSKQII